MIWKKAEVGSGRKKGFSSGVKSYLNQNHEYSKGWLHHESRTEEGDAELENYLKDKRKLSD